MPKIILMGVRPSPLAIKQAEEIQNLLPFMRFKTVLIETRGDKDKQTPFSAVEGSDFFTREIEKALLDGDIDAAVHSAKDLEEKIPPGLAIAAITVSISSYECLVSRGNKKLDQLPAGARVGTSSSKRKARLLSYRPDLEVSDIRGTIEERLGQLDQGRFDAVIMAQAALVRLGLKARIAQIISPEIIEPHPLQGSLAVQVRARDAWLIRLFSAIDTREEASLYEDKS